MADDWFPPTPANPLPVTVIDKAPANVATYHPPTVDNPLPVWIEGGAVAMPEPPDNQLYGRRGPAGSGVWALISASAGPPEAPTDGAIYGRGHVGGVQAWSPVLPLSGGTLTGALNLAADPVSGLQAATKNYVDNKTYPYLPLAGGTLTGALTLALDPVNPLQASTKQYVDNAIAGIGGPYLPLTGGTISGSLVIGTPPAGSLGAGTLNLSGMIRVNRNSGSLLADSFDPVLQLAGANNTTPEILLDGYGAGAAFNLRFRFARGTQAIPAPPQASDPLGTVGFLGYATTGYVANAAARIVGVAAENWTNTANGSQILFYTTAPGATPAAGAPQLTLARGLVVGNPTGGDLGLGAVNAASLNVNGSAVALAAQLSNYLQLSGGTMTGALNLATDPTAAAQAATKQYVDNQVTAAPYLPLAGGTISGSPGSLVIGTPPGGSLGVGTLNMSGMLRVNLNAAAPPAPPANTVLHLAHQTGIAPRVVLDGYGFGGNHTIRRANGSAAAPSGLVANDTIGQYVFIGYGTTAYSTTFRAGIQGRAVENWTDTAQGTYINFLTTPPGSAANVTAMTLGQGLVIGTPLPGDLGPGTLDMSGVLQVNQNAAAAPAGPATLISAAGADNASPRIGVYGFGAAGTNGPHLDLNFASGTGAAPGPVPSGQNIGTLGWFGYGATGYSGRRAGISCFALENWTDTAGGTQLIFQTTAIGSGAPATRMLLAQGLQIGTPPDGDLGPGTLNTSGMLQANANAVAAVPWAGSLLHLNGADGTSTRLTIDANGGNPALVFRSNRGTGAAPAPPIAGNPLGALNFQAWAPGGFTGQAALISGIASENWDATHNGTAITFGTTAPGLPAVANVVTRAQIGLGMQLGAPPDGDLGAGTQNQTGILQVNMNAASPPPFAAGWGVRVVGADAAVPRYLLDGFGTLGRFDFRRTNGTGAAPVGVNSGDQLGVMGWFGYIGASAVMSGVRAGIQGVAADTYTATAQGTNLSFNVTAIGSTALTSGAMLLDNGANLTILGATATKPGGGSWTAPSSLAVKKNVENYTRGLAELRQLQPISFEYNGELGTIADGKRYVGLAAEAVRDLMPEMLSLAKVTRYHAKGEDDVEVVEHPTVLLDPSALTYALMNAVYELEQRLAILEELGRRGD